MAGPYFATVLNDVVQRPRLDDDEGVFGRTWRDGKGGGKSGAAMQKVRMWRCGYCSTTSFMERNFCWGCKREKPARVEIVEEAWRTSALGRPTRGGAFMEFARAQGGKGTEGERRMEAGRHGTESPGRAWLGLESGQRWENAEAHGVGVYQEQGGNEGGAEARKKGGKGGKKSYRDALEGGQVEKTKKEEAEKGNQRFEEKEVGRRLGEEKRS